MSGLTYGIMSVKNGIETVICERNPRVGKKLAQTGNGKCNIGNANLSHKNFNDCKLVPLVLDSVPQEVYAQFLQSCGIFTTADDQGRMYPITESAASVVDSLRFQFAKYGGKILTDCEVSKITRTNGGYLTQVDGEQFDKVVLACGSQSSAQATCAESLLGAQYFTKTVPSLVPIKIAGMPKQLNGLRAKANVTLLADNLSLGSEYGEVQFKDYGLSGICVYNLSALIARNTVAGKGTLKYEICLDLVPTFTETQLAQILKNRVADGVETYFYGILHNKIAETLVKRVGTNPEKLAHEAKCMKFTVDRLLDFSKSQVTAGGINEEYLNLHTLQTPNGIIAIGEVLNVDGLCGGNNLYFAAASAIYLFDDNQRKIAFSKQ